MVLKYYVETDLELQLKIRILEKKDIKKNYFTKVYIKEYRISYQ